MLVLREWERPVGHSLETRGLERTHDVMTGSLPETIRSRMTKRLSRILGLETAEALGQFDIMAWMMERQRRRLGKTSRSGLGRSCFQSPSSSR